MPHALTAIALLQVAASYATPPTVSAPLLGYSLTGSTLTRYVGIPGACYTTPDLDLTPYQLLRSASSAPVALLLPLAGEPRLVYRTDSATFTVPLPDTPNTIAVSPLGSYFAAASSDHVRVFDRAGTLRASTDLTAFLPTGAAITEISAGDEGDLLIAAANTFWYSQKPGLSFVPVPLALSHIAFAPRDHLVIAYDSAAARIIAIHPSSGFAVEPLVTSRDHSLPPAEIHFGADGTAIWLTDPTLGLVRYDLPTRQSTSFSVAPGTLGAAVAPGIFQWNKPDGGTAILDTTQAQPIVFLVPAGGTQQ
jgi:hypothetical protein